MTKMSRLAGLWVVGWLATNGVISGCESGASDSLFESRVDHLPIPQHPFLAPNGKSNMHNDAYMTDTYEIDGPLGLSTQVLLTSYAEDINTCVTIAFDRRGRLITTSATMLEFNILLLDPVSLEVLASYGLPLRHITDPLFPYDDTSGAAYFVLDHQDRVLLADADNNIQLIQYQENLGRFRLLRKFALAEFVVALDPPARDHVQMTIPDWQGQYLWFTTRYGVVGTIHWESGKVNVFRLPEEEIQNSFAVAEDGAYIISDHAMYRFKHDQFGTPVVDWRKGYDRGTRVKPSNFNQGSGTTPQLFGELVAISDNAEPQMNILFLKRSDGSLVCQTPVFEKDRSTTENALVGWVRMGKQGLEYSVIVDNNYGIERAKILESGRSWVDHEGGLARIDLIPDGALGFLCETVWHSLEKSSQVLPKLSLTCGLLYIYTYETLLGGEYLWYFTALDFETGETRFKVPTGSGLEYANFGPPLILGPDGSAYLGTMGGLLRIQDNGAPALYP